MIRREFFGVFAGLFAWVPSIGKNGVLNNRWESPEIEPSKKTTRRFTGTIRNFEWNLRWLLEEPQGNLWHFQVFAEYRGNGSPTRESIDKFLRGEDRLPKYFVGPFVRQEYQVDCFEKTITADFWKVWKHG